MSAPRLGAVPYTLAFAEPLRTARGLWEARRGVGLALLEEGGALLGLGEAAPLPDWGTETPEEAEAALASRALPPLPAGGPAAGPDAGLDAEIDAWLDACGPLGPAARAGLELAALDALARRAGAPLFGGPPVASVALNALVRAEAPQAAAAEACALAAEGYRALKLKVGARAPGQDAARAKAVREAVGPGVALRLDANGAWADPEAAAEALAPFAGLGVAYVEEPLAAPSAPALAALAERTGLLFALDEALARLAPEEALGWPGVGAIVLKPAALGYRRAAAIARRAAAAGRTVVFTSALDGGVASLGAARLAAALAPGTAHGFATVTGFARPWAALASGFAGGAWALPEGPGLGLAAAPWEGAAHAAA